MHKVFRRLILQTIGPIHAVGPNKLVLTIRGPSLFSVTIQMDAMLLVKLQIEHKLTVFYCGLYFNKIPVQYLLLSG